MNRLRFGQSLTELVPSFGKKERNGAITKERNEERNGVPGFGGTRGAGNCQTLNLGPGVFFSKLPVISTFWNDPKNQNWRTF